MKLEMQQTGAWTTISKLKSTKSMKRSLNIRNHELQRPNYREIQTANSNYIDLRLYEMEAEKNLHLSEILTLYEGNP